MNSPTSAAASLNRDLTASTGPRLVRLGFDLCLASLLAAGVSAVVWIWRAVAAGHRPALSASFGLIWAAGWLAMLGSAWMLTLRRTRVDAPAASQLETQFVRFGALGVAILSMLASWRYSWDDADSWLFATALHAFGAIWFAPFIRSWGALKLVHEHPDETRRCRQVSWRVLVVGLASAPVLALGERARDVAEAHPALLGLFALTSLLGVFVFADWMALLLRLRRLYKTATGPLPISASG